jgi:hypothetical protein
LIQYTLRVSLEQFAERGERKLPIPKMLSGANVVEISDIQECEIARRFPTNQNVTLLSQTLASPVSCS